MGLSTNIFFVVWICVAAGQLLGPEKEGEKDPAMFEGDIMVTNQLLSELGEMKTGKKEGIGMYDALKRGQWPGGIVPYTIAPGHERGLTKPVKEAIAIYNKALGKCVQWKYYSMNTIRRKKMKNYIQFYQGRGCFSALGRQRGAQQISLQVPGCTRQIGTTVHEMMHALGFFHEQSRLDRDKYIYVNFNNIDPKMRYNFEKYKNGQADTYGAPYDVGSVMHYGNYAFAVNRKSKTIVSRKNANQKLGQRKGLSKIDIMQLRKYYNCKKGHGGSDKGAVKPDANTCKDQYNRCHLKRRQCDEPTVQKYCKKTCKLCGKKTQSKCKDTNKKCKRWLKKGYCISGNRYYYYVTRRCQKTCKLC